MNETTGTKNGGENGMHAMQTPPVVSPKEWEVAHAVKERP
jgi:hypothetical protein